MNPLAELLNLVVQLLQSILLLLEDLIRGLIQGLNLFQLQL
ncbi:hypothetical protein WIW90_07500 [Sulfolobaceae archaeon RB850M]